MTRFIGHAKIKGNKLYLDKVGAANLHKLAKKLGTTPRKLIIAALKRMIANEKAKVTGD